MTIEKQNAINAARPTLYGVTVRVEVSLPPALVTRVVHFLDAYPAANWDSVAEAALEKYLDITG